MKHRIISLILALLLILPAFTGCGNESTPPPQVTESQETMPDVPETARPVAETEEETIPEVITFDVPQTIDFGEFDFSGVKHIDIYGLRDKKVTLTDSDDISAIISTINQIQGENPVSSAGHYGCQYTIMMYDTSEPAEHGEPLFQIHICNGNIGPKENWFLYGVHEIIGGFSYPSLFTMKGISCEEVVKACDKYYSEEFRYYK